jgi:hypothetical protein
MAGKAAERVALDTLNRLIDRQLQACTEPTKEEWIKQTRPLFFKTDSAGRVVGVLIEGSQYVMPTDKWFGYFAAFEKLEYIQLDWCGEYITGKGLAHIAGLKRLKALNLWTCAVRDSAIAHLLPLKSLEWLRLCETRITDRSLKTLAQFPRLRGLEMYSTSITDKGLVHLRGCRKLEHLDLSGTKVTEAGVKELAGYLPSGCYIQAAALG